MMIKISMVKISKDPTEFKAINDKLIYSYMSKKYVTLLQNNGTYKNYIGTAFNGMIYDTIPVIDDGDESLLIKDISSFVSGISLRNNQCIFGLVDKSECNLIPVANNDKIPDNFMIQINGYPPFVYIWKNIIPYFIPELEEANARVDMLYYKEHDIADFDYSEADPLTFIPTFLPIKDCIEKEDQ